MQEAPGFPSWEGRGLFYFPGLFLKVDAIHGLGYFIVAIPLAALDCVLEHFSRHLGSLFVLTNFRDFFMCCHGIHPFWPAIIRPGGAAPGDCLAAVSAIILDYIGNSSEERIWQTAELPF